MWSRRNKPSRRGFSLPELALCAAIIGLLSALAVVGIIRHRQNAEDTRVQAELNSIYKAMEAFRQVYGRYPASYAQLREFISIPDFDQRYDINPNP